MSEFKHRMTLAVPQAHIEDANHLALIVGQFAADINTFVDSTWQDANGNLYAVCSTVIKPVVLGMFGINLSDITLPLHAQNADIQAAQRALDMVIMYKQGDKASTTSIMCAIDFEPLQVFSDMGLTIVRDGEVINAY
ncbi:hypothetical protein ACOBWA_08410 [Psychrobacter sp. ER1]|uniref:hypothetical protein n=1 Tax=Psychrobacter sp. ER1 TaxID=3406645 RepID=UPI003B43A04F